MQTKRGSMLIVIILAVLALAIVGTVVYKNSGGNFNLSGQNLQNVSSDESELTKGDEISDIETDLNSTQVDNLDAGIVGISSEVE